MGYTGDSQVERVTAGASSFAHSLLGLGSAKDGSGTSYYTRDNRGTLVGQRAPAGRYYYLFDGPGSVAALTNSAGAVVNTYAYDPYGKLVSSTGTVANPWRFGGAYGAYTDASTGLVKIGQRFYDPGLGRWTQVDPVPHTFDPVQANRYSYAACNPVIYTDPSGLDHCRHSVLPSRPSGLVISSSQRSTPHSWHPHPRQ